jgi:hypothetical protein
MTSIAGSTHAVANPPAIALTDSSAHFLSAPPIPIGTRADPSERSEPACRWRKRHPSGLPYGGKASLVARTLLMVRKQTVAASLADGTDHTRLRTLREGCETYIASQRWDYYCTLTFRFEVTESVGAKEFEVGFIPRLQQRSQGKVLYLAVSSRNWHEGRVHVHALLRLVVPVEAPQVRAAWRAGHAAIEPFVPQGGAGPYIARHIAGTDAEVMVRE